MSVVFLNLPIEFYSPVSGGAIATIIAEGARVLEAQGIDVSILTRVDAHPLHPHGRVIPLRACGREDLHFFQRRLSAWRGRSELWDWPYFDRYQRAVREALAQLPEPPETLVLFNDLQSAVFLKDLLPSTRLFVWLQNEQRTRLVDLAATMRATDGWLACSDYIREWTVAQHHFAADKVFTVPSGVNLEQFYPRVDFDSPGPEVRVLFVGRLDPNKGADLALDAVATLRAEELPVSITMAGGKWFYRQGGEESDPYLQLLQVKLAATQGTGLGHVSRDRVPQVFREHDVVCVLSRSQEPFGLVVLEAMASGCAVIASDRGGLPQACGGAALLVDPDQPGDILQALRSLVVDPATLAHWKRQAVARAQQASWEHAVELLSSHLQPEPMPV